MPSGKSMPTSSWLGGQIPIGNVPHLNGTEGGGLVVLQVVVVAEDVGGGVVVLHRQVLQNLGVDLLEGGLPLGHVRCRLLDLLLLVDGGVLVVHVVRATLIGGVGTPKEGVVVG